MCNKVCDHQKQEAGHVKVAVDQKWKCDKAEAKADLQAVSRPHHPGIFAASRFNTSYTAIKWMLKGKEMMTSHVAMTRKLLVAVSLKDYTARKPQSFLSLPNMNP